MSFFDNIEPETKKQFLQTAQESLSLELAQILIRTGQDPDNFDINNFNPDPSVIIPDAEIRVGQICDGLKIISAKLEALG